MRHRWLCQEVQMSRIPTSAGAAGFEIRFQSLFHPGRAVSFPCDAQGCVHLDALSERAGQAYLRARALVGRDYAAPAVLASDLQ